MAESKYLQVTPQYKATTFDERIKPLVLYKQEYDRQQDAYDKLLEDTLMLENLKGSDVDADLYRQYSQWRGELNNAADILSNTGRLDMQSVRDLRRQYLNELKPMEDKYKHRNSLMLKQAAEYSPYTLFDKDFSKISVADTNLDDNYRTYKLDDIEKNAFARLSERYIQTGIPSDPQEDIDELLGDIDTRGLSEDQIATIRDSISSGFTKAQRTVTEYNLQQERARKQDAYQELQGERLRKLIDRNPGGDGYDDGDINPFGPSKKNPAAGKKPVKTIEGNAGDKIDIFKLTDDGTDYYFMMRGGKPVLIDSSIIGEDGTVAYSSLYNAAYGESPAAYYDGREYFVRGDGKVYSEASGTVSPTQSYMIRTGSEMKQFLNDHPEYAGSLMQVAKEKYGVKDVFNSDLLNFKDVNVRIYTPTGRDTYAKTQVAVSLKEKSGNSERFTLIDGLVPSDDDTPEYPISSPADTARVQQTPAPQGVGNTVI